MRHRLFIPAATALLFALAACTQDELAGDNRLPEGEYPVVIRATGLSVEATPLAAPSTRASVDGDWQGVTSVALKMGDAVKEYTVTASTDFKSATLSRETRTTGPAATRLPYRHGGPSTMPTSHRCLP